MSGSSLYQVGLSGLMAFQRAINTAGNNISNSNTEGYHRQRIDLQTRSSTLDSGSYLGQGVKTTGVTRIVDEFYVHQMRDNQSNYHRDATISQYADQLDTLLADSNTGLSTSMQNYFDSMESWANDPSSITNRQVVITQSEMLVNRFNHINSTISDLYSAVDERLVQYSQEINAISQNIANLNNNILQSSSGSNTVPNDMLDLRDGLINDLSELINIQTMMGAEGEVNIYIGNGDPLVVGSEYHQLSAVDMPSNSGQKSIAIRMGNKDIVINSDNLGGKIGGVTEFRESILNPIKLGMDQLAVGFTDSINQQHMKGVTLLGNLGGEFFNNVTESNLINYSDNQGNATGQVVVTDVGKLQGSYYDVKYDGLYNITRRSDGEFIGSFSPGTIDLSSSEGFSIVTTGNAISGDEFVIKPGDSASGRIKLEISDPKDLAGSSPILTQINTNNKGSGVIQLDSITDINGTEFTTTPNSLVPPILIRFTSDTTYDILDNTNSSTPVALVPPQTGLTFTPGESNLVLPNGLYNYQISINGYPESGDEFNVDYNVDGVSDNRNSLNMSNMDFERLLSDNTMSFSDLYHGIVTQVGNKAREINISEAANQSLMRQSMDQVQSVSGVNLDEEAANILLFQQSYQAAAKIISIASQMFDVLFDATR